MGRNGWGAQVWGRRVVRLPADGVLLVATDLQGNLADYRALMAVYEREEAAGNRPILAFTGDLVHGPHEALHKPGAWPVHLGTPYRDASARLLQQIKRHSRKRRVFSLLGNHEHAHVGGPIVSKFHPDEAAVLERALGGDRDRMVAFMRSFPLIAVAPCGVVLCHGAPGASEPDLDAFERLEYDGFRHFSAMQMATSGTLGTLLWSRSATPEQARALLSATAVDGCENRLVVYGHDVVWEGYAKLGAEQLCLSTSYAVPDGNKFYLRLELAERYASSDALEEGRELRRLYPDAPGSVPFPY